MFSTKIFLLCLSFFFTLLLLSTFFHSAISKCWFFIQIYQSSLLWFLSQILSSFHLLILLFHFFILKYSISNLIYMDLGCEVRTALYCPTLFMKLCIFSPQTWKVIFTIHIFGMYLGLFLCFLSCSNHLSSHVSIPHSFNYVKFIMYLVSFYSFKCS